MQTRSRSMGWSLALLAACGLGATGCNYNWRREPNARVEDPAPTGTGIPAASRGTSLPPSGSTNPPAATTAPTTDSLWSVVHVSLVGTLAGVAVDSPAEPQVNVTTRASTGALRVDATDTAGRRWVMSSVAFARPLDLAAVPLGTEYDSALPRTDPLALTSTLGCSGPQPGQYAFDGQATRTVVRVDAGSRDNTRTLRLIAQYPSGAVEAEVELELP